jgi:hypothetical protein
MTASLIIFPLRSNSPYFEANGRPASESTQYFLTLRSLKKVIAPYGCRLAPEIGENRWFARESKRLFAVLAGGFGAFFHQPFGLNLSMPSERFFLCPPTG